MKFYFGLPDGKIIEVFPKMIKKNLKLNRNLILERKGQIYVNLIDFIINLWDTKKLLVI